MRGYAAKTHESYLAHLQRFLRFRHVCPGSHDLDALPRCRVPRSVRTTSIRTGGCSTCGRERGGRTGLLGHASLATTQIYTHVSSEEIAAIESPLDDLD